MEKDYNGGMGERGGGELGGNVGRESKISADSAISALSA